MRVFLLVFCEKGREEEKHETVVSGKIASEKREGVGLSAAHV